MFASERVALLQIDRENELVFVGCLGEQAGSNFNAETLYQPNRWNNMKTTWQVTVVSAIGRQKIGKARSVTKRSGRLFSLNRPQMFFPERRHARTIVPSIAARVGPAVPRNTNTPRGPRAASTRDTASARR